MGGPRLAPHSPQFSWARDRPGGDREGLPAPGLTCAALHAGVPERQVCVSEPGVLASVRPQPAAIPGVAWTTP